MPAEPRWLSVDEIIELNSEIVAATGEPFGVLDLGLLVSACCRPKNHYDYDGVADVVTLAIILLFAIARNHAFVQGNKRTGFEAAVIFLEANGYAVDIPDHETVADWIIEAVAHEVDESLVEHAFRLSTYPA